MIKCLNSFIKFVFIFSIFSLTTFIYAQQVNFTGSIKNKSNNPLQGANVLLLPKSKNISPSFGSTNKDGLFSIKVFSDEVYELAITFIGYVTIKKNIKFSEENFVNNYVLEESVNELEEVVLNYKPSIQIKKDTTVYNVDGFINGKERKLKNVLKKLPGLEVDRDGNVFFKEKKVNKVLVEDKVFFNGKTKLAVENIPADVVDEIQMIEDHHEISFLKGLKDSGDLVMNIKLRENKKKFIFGDIELGLGIKDRYRLHPSVFKYSPKVLVNAIGDYNNTYNRSFTISDYFGFEGDVSKEKINDIFNSSVVKFLQKKDYYKNNHLFGGFNIQVNPNSKNEFRFFTLQLKDESNSKTNDLNIYRTNQSIEQREQELYNDNSIKLVKLHYKYTPDKNTVLKLQSFLEYSNLKGNNTNYSKSANGIFDYDNGNTSTNEIFNFNGSFNKWFSEKHTSTVDFNYSNKKLNSNEYWQSDDNLFFQEIPIVEDNFYNVFGTEVNKLINLELELKHYFRLTRADLVTFGLSNIVKSRSIITSNGQKETGGIKTIFDDYINDFRTNFLETKFSLGYKRYFGNVSLNTNLNYSNVLWKDVITTDNHNFLTTKLLPSIFIEWELSENKKIKLGYSKSISPSIPVDRLPNSRILDFNQVYVGNKNLDLSSQDRLLFTYSSFKSYGLSSYFNAGYRKIERAFTKENIFDGIYGITSPLQLEKESKGYEASLRFKYNRRYWYLALTNSYYLRDTPVVFNSTEANSTTKSINSNLSFKTNLEEFPNFEVEIKNGYFFSKTPFFKNNSYSLDLDMATEYDYNDWKFKAYYIFNFFKNKSRSNSTNFNQINGSVFYRKEDSPWEYGIELRNITNDKVKTSNTNTINRYYERSVYVFPITVMFNVYYKL
ncbi:MAG: carboxypeptidase-like regulatory domain-containing protein [Cellulophaga sp.]|uniref:carboxypeptidase-like regulatory domain-containing protein n=1 Tax=unclassified Cellulophaga TaxID=2634405 RepID=UPI0026E17693|nr:MULTISPECIES: carboxypeptidase-like regulatory domain-containing protein [unclassified Cellulophaga]MDO6491190.1 carboxypeptidase-like regulatory domain-containing protein [Cellulophaga sp. 2_MG-2023]MDO6495277.1 carboxypeptidase-like regulatory domain-containing protein [Cellulophaga sp. 3_MG-2023]